MPTRVIVHVDLDYFYAQCEENLNPAICGKPVVVCVYSGRTEESGAVSTCNYEARKYGVRAGIPIVRAKKLLEKVDAIYVPMNRPFYEQVSDRIMELLKSYGDLYEKVGIDEAFLDLSSRTNGDFAEAGRIAQEIKQQLFQREHITCSIGIAANKLLAKIASDYQKPDGLTTVKPEDAESFLKPMEVGKIPGIGRKAEEKLNQLHVRNVEELSGLEPAILIETFGKSLGNYLYHAARGQDDEPVKEREQPTQFSRIRTLKQNTREIQEITPLLRELAKAASEKMMEAGKTCKSIGVIAVLDDLSIHGKSRMLESQTSDVTLIQQLSNELMEEFLQSMPTAVLRRVGVKLSGLSKKGGQTDISTFLRG